jgi:hypothetical protein
VIAGPSTLRVDVASPGKPLTMASDGPGLTISVALGRRTVVSHDDSSDSPKGRACTWQRIRRDIKIGRKCRWCMLTVQRDKAN